MIVRGEASVCNGSEAAIIPRPGSRHCDVGLGADPLEVREGWLADVRSEPLPGYFVRMSAMTTVSNIPALFQFIAVDERMVVSVIESGGGYRFVEERELWAPPANGLDGYRYWAETSHSGVYASHDEALLAARAEIGWLADLSTRTDVNVAYGSGADIRSSLGSGPSA